MHRFRAAVQGEDSFLTCAGAQRARMPAGRLAPQDETRTEERLFRVVKGSGLDGTFISV